MVTLTDFLRHLSPAVRLERRRWIYALADRWAEKLTEKYGDRGHALAAVRRRQVSTTRAHAPLRNHVWAQVARRLKYR